MNKFDTLKVGDVVTRMLAGVIPMELKVTELKDDLIICGAWKFSKNNGAEIDEDLGWDEKHSGGYIKFKD
jgi:hypothetical protein